MKLVATPFIKNLQNSPEINLGQFELIEDIVSALSCWNNLSSLGYVESMKVMNQGNVADTVQ